MSRGKAAQAADDESLLQDVDRAGLWLYTTSWFRLFAGFILMATGAFICAAAQFLFLPSRNLRVRISNVYGTVIGRAMFWVSGSKIHAEGHEEALARGPAIWAMNHCSLLDIPLGIWLSPPGTVGVGKKEVIRYPLFGLLYILSGHLRIDRRDTQSAVASMKKMVGFVRDCELCIFIWPEGTRSRDGRLQTIKKGIAHLAIQTGLPIQPMVTKGTYRAWPKGPPAIRPTRVEIEFPAPIDTTGWSADTLHEHLAEMEEVFTDALPPEQRPLSPLR